MAKLLVVLVASSSPLLLWAFIAAAARRKLFTLGSMLRVLHIWHRLLVIIGAVLLLGWYEKPPALYGWGALIFSFVLIWPEQWLKHQMEPPPASPVPGNQ